jgi:hypothetical protein
MAIQKMTVVFANSDGGEFVVGIAGVDEEQILSQVRDSLRRIRRLCGPRSWGVKAWALLSNDHQTQTGS